MMDTFPPPLPDHQPVPGKTWGRYEIVKRIGAGGMAEAYLATALGMESFRRQVVLKVILPERAADDQYVKMFNDEARISSRLRHPNIVQVFDFERIEGRSAIIMEYVEGYDLGTILAKGSKCGRPLPPALAVQITAAAAAGLQHAHERGIIHRDVSPSNLLVSIEGEVKVVDFGIAKAADRSTVTQAGIVKGKSSYLSPEAASGKAVDPRADQFALCVVLWEALTGKRLFDGENDFARLLAILHEPATHPSAACAACPADLDAAVCRGLSKDPADRFRDMAELEERLRGIERTMQAGTGPISLRAFVRRLHEDEAPSDPPRPEAQPDPGRVLTLHDPIPEPPPAGNDDATVLLAEAEAGGDATVEMGTSIARTVAAWGQIPADRAAPVPGSVAAAAGLGLLRLGGRAGWLALVALLGGLSAGGFLLALSDEAPPSEAVEVASNYTGRVPPVHDRAGAPAASPRWGPDPVRAGATSSAWPGRPAEASSSHTPRSSAWTGGFGLLAGIDAALEAGDLSSTDDLLQHCAGNSCRERLDRLAGAYWSVGERRKAADWYGRLLRQTIAPAERTRIAAMIEALGGTHGR